MNTASSPLSEEAFAVAAALLRGSDEKKPQEIALAATQVAQHLGVPGVRACMRLYHVFRGIPSALWALQHCSEVIENAPPEEDSWEQLDGEAQFHALYQQDAEPVLNRIKQLDPLLWEWVVTHIYGRVLGQGLLSLEDQERLAMLLLAADGCWPQWESHRRIARRFGVSPIQLQEDAIQHGWPSGSAARASQQITDRE